MDALIGALVGGLLTIAGGIAGTYLLADLERKREKQRQRERHATAVRIVFFELQNNGAALIGIGRGVKGGHPLSNAAYLSVTPDLYALLPAHIAADVSFCYVFATVERIAPESVDDLLVKWVGTLSELADYGRTLGLELPAIGKATASEWFRDTYGTKAERPEK